MGRNSNTVAYNCTIQRFDDHSIAMLPSFCLHNRAMDESVLTMSRQQKQSDSTKQQLVRVCLPYQCTVHVWRVGRLKVKLPARLPLIAYFLPQLLPTGRGASLTCAAQSCRSPAATTRSRCPCWPRAGLDSRWCWPVGQSVRKSQASASG